MNSLRAGGELLGQSLALYRRHFLALALCAGVVLLPVELAGAAAYWRFGAETTPLASLSAESDAAAARKADFARRLADLRRRERAATTPAEREAVRAATEELYANARAASQAQSAHYWVVFTVAAARLLRLLVFSLAIALVQGAAFAVASAALLAFAADRLRGGQRGVRGAWLAVRPHAPALLATGALGFALVALGLYACVLPGLAALLLFGLAAPVVLVERRTGFAALARSARLVRLRPLPALVIELGAAAAFAVPDLLAPRYLPPLASRLFEPLWLLLVAPLPAIALGLLYARVRAETEQVPREELVAQLADGT